MTCSALYRLSISRLSLQDVWGELFLLQAAYWPVDILVVAKHIEEEGKILPRRVVSVIMECRQLQLDLLERSLLETIILARKGEQKII
ncbi:nuclear receptor subfamily 2 group E member 1 [Caerostris extrusa]|uniref:Nuclear receptor subfamily 2 group E member 1 n=1 Tax=Caerostris extrusa TaxID=172846 RepID=A0AAV4N990_CAEEX|nr:nuclear receptor subfamily 2 group E member 1 [Caerostris extrusa]